ncbi:unannotated protein [freshwater metagenome]|uniref:Unannotated protein n=1 Tax=freshwater metagenome TaxID=449393 RepID=A0A6J7HF51_9ZZZZ|nr:hypothetical protein [Actinomycetota bacterium]
MTLFLKAKRAGSIPSLIFFVIFFTLFSILGSVFLALESGNPINKVTHSLYGSQSFNEEAGKYVVNKFLEKSTGEERTIFLEKGPQISTAVTNLLGNPLFHQEADKISEVVYSYYAMGSKEIKSVDVRPIANLALAGLVNIDPQFKELNKELDKIKPIKLKAQKDGPDVAQIRSILNLAIVLLLVLSFAMLFLYVMFARSRKDTLRWPGLVLFLQGVSLTSIFLVANSLIANQVNTSKDSLLRIGLPLAAHPLLAPFMLVGLLELIIGLGLFVGSFLRQLNGSSTPAVAIS